MRTRVELTWPKRPVSAPHADLGKRQRWKSRCGRYRVERFLQSTRRFMALYSEPLSGFVWHVVSDHRTLSAAQRSCERHARQLAKEGR